VVYQLVSFLASAWHVRGGGRVAGRSVESVNHTTVGIEIENIGKVRRFDLGDGLHYQRWPYFRVVNGAASSSAGLDPALKVDPTRVVTYKGRFFDGFPDPQLAAYQSLLAALVGQYGWQRQFCGMGHVDYEPERKEDPWPLFHDQLLPVILDRIFSPAAQ
jgi:N-acetyl-anhydromuramyl-L-alanine amidase AmpD